MDSLVFVKAQRVVIAVVLLGSAALFWRGTADVFNLAKVTVALLGALAALVLAAVVAARERRVLVPRAPAVPLACAFLLAAVVAVFVSDTPAISVVGNYQRYAGFVSYASYLVLFLVTAMAFDEDSTFILPKVLLVAMAGPVVYGVLQMADIDPFDWTTYDFTDVFGTFGNANFLAGFLGIAVPLAAWTALARDADPGWRVTGGALAVGGLVVAVGTESFQGPVVAGFAAAAVLFLAAWDRREQLRPLARRRRWAIALLVIGGLAVAALLAPHVVGEVDEGLEPRILMWRTAGSIFADHPVVGSGLDTYEQLFFRHRPTRHAVLYGFENAQQPHNVPLSMFSNGGLLLGSAYLAFVVATGYALVKGLRTAEGPSRRLLTGLGVAWGAYQLQSLVSVDVPPLAVLHWVLAGAILAVARPAGCWDWSLPGRSARERDRRARDRRRQRRRRPQPVRGSDMAWTAGIAVVAVGAAWFAVLPLRADAAAADGSEAAARGDGDEALEELDRATDLGPWRGHYWFLQTALLERLGDLGAARSAAVEAAEREPGSSPYALLNARLAEKAGDAAGTQQWFEEAVRRDPKHPAVYVEAAQHYLEAGSEARAVELLDRAAELSGQQPSILLLLAEAHAAVGSPEQARVTYERVLELDPGNAEAVRGIAALEGQDPASEQ